MSRSPEGARMQQVDLEEGQSSGRRTSAEGSGTNIGRVAALKDGGTVVRCYFYRGFVGGLFAQHRRRSNRRAVRRNLQRRINDYTRCIFLLFCCLLALTLIVLAGVTVWAIFVVEKNNTVCDRPLRTFLLVYFGGVVYAILKSIITRVLLCYNPSTDPEKPLRVKIHDAIFTAFCFAWPIIGVVWLASSDTCSSTAPKLFAVSTAIVVLLIVAWVLTLLGPPILIGILMLAIRRGHIRVAKERQQKVDRVISALRIVSPEEASKVAEECSVCLT
ncbi:hypothetical protein FOZ63_026771, partial [Perkinsus olseni]